MATPDATTPDATAPDATAPDAAAPDATAPDAAAPEGEWLWESAAAAAALLAVAPDALGGVVLRARPGPVREHWLALFREFVGATTWRKIPCNVSEARLVGGLDLPATLKSGSPVLQTGLLAELHQGIAELAMAERAERSTVALLSRALDTGEMRLERDGLSAVAPAQLAVIALDESARDDESVDPALHERLAFHLDLTGVGIRDLDDAPWTQRDIDTARAALATSVLDDEDLNALCATADMLGVASLRALQLAAASARVAAALGGRSQPSQADLEQAIRLVLLPRATRVPALEAPADDDSEPSPETPPPESESEPEDSTEASSQPGDQEKLIDATLASLPPNLLASLLAAGRARQSRTTGRAGQAVRSHARGRPMGTGPGDPRRGQRLSLVATLRTAAPWQALRRRDAPENRQAGGVLVEREDFRVVRFRDRSETTTIFVVDASGSAALNRLAEAKGAVELLLADCYVRRDQVALIAFRGEAAEVLLPPTRSLVRAKRNLAALPGGGGTPLASAVELAGLMGDSVRSRGSTPALVFLTDGRANIGRDGSRGREAAADDLQHACSQFRNLGLEGMVIDTSPRPNRSAEQLARELHLQYLPLPHADARQLREAVEIASA